MNHERHEKLEKFIFKEESYSLKGTNLEVYKYKKMGSGFFDKIKL